MAELALGKRTKLDNWALSAFGVRPDCQQRGIGSALMAAAEAKVIASLPAMVLWCLFASLAYSAIDRIGRENGLLGDGQRT
jgi:ribosomal protein S18 acetylase RimI-like enzyme